MPHRQISLALSLVCLVIPPLGRAACDCDGVPFQAARSIKIGLEAQVLESVLVNEDRGKIKLGARAYMPSSTNLTAHQVFAGAETNTGSVNANIVRFHPLATVAGPVVGPLALPVIEPFCTVPSGSCGTEAVFATADAGVVTLSPGSYADVRIGRAGFVRLLPGTYDVCNLSVARGGAMVNEGPVTMNVLGNVRVAADGLIVPGTNQPRIEMNVSGPKVVFGLGAVVRAEVTAPTSRFKIGRQGSLDGCFCVRDGKIGTEASASCTVFGSPGAAFLD